MPKTIFRDVLPTKRLLKDALFKLKILDSISNPDLTETYKNKLQKSIDDFKKSIETFVNSNCSEQFDNRNYSDLDIKRPDPTPAVKII